jgi:hypothetical protein
LGKQSRPFKSDKRKKELLRQKKQEEKRLRRFKKDTAPAQDAEIEHPGDTTQETIISQ